MSRANRVAQKSGAVARDFLRVCFCIAAFCLFFPLVIRYAMRGDWIGAGVALLAALCAGPLLAPKEEDT